MKKTKIAFFIDTLYENLDGVSLTSHHIISRLPSNCEAIFFTAWPPMIDGFPFPFYTIRSFKIPFQHGYRIGLPKKSRVFKILDEFNPDLIHWSSPTFLGRCALAYAHSRNIPNITIYHTHFFSYIDYFKWLPFKSWISSRLSQKAFDFYSKSDRVLFPTEEIEKYLLNIGLKKEKLKIWGRGVDSELFHPSRRNKEYFKDKKIPSGIKLLFVSRLVKYKETDTLIRLSNILPENYQLIIVGDGPDSERMKSKCSPNHTFFLGRVEGIELATIYASSDLFIFPSISETYGNVINEALASGLPVIASNGGGSKNIIEDQKTGFLLPPKKEHLFLEKVEFLSKNPDLLKNFSINARIFAEKRSWDYMVKILINEYTELVSIKKVE